jgi:hypothetical protein
MLLLLLQRALAQKQVRLPLVSNLAYSGSLPTAQGAASYLLVGCDQAATPDQLKDCPLAVLLPLPGGTALQLLFSGLGPLLVAPDLKLAKNSGKPVTAFANVMALDMFGHGYSGNASAQNY